MIYFTKWLYIDQPTSKSWRGTLFKDLEDLQGYYATTWKYQVGNLRGLMIGVGETSKSVTPTGVILVDSAGQLVYQRGTDIVVLTTGLRQPVSLNLLPPELRKPT